MEVNYLDVLRHLGQVVYNKKGFNIFAIDVRGNSSITDFCFVADGNVSRHLAALADEIDACLSSYGFDCRCIEGKGGDWIVMDFNEIMVHLFTPSLREHYRIEELWKEGEVVDLEIKVVPE